MRELVGVIRLSLIRAKLVTTSARQRARGSGTADKEQNSNLTDNTLSLGVTVVRFHRREQPVIRTDNTKTREKGL